MQKSRTKFKNSANTTLLHCKKMKKIQSWKQITALEKIPNKEPGLDSWKLNTSTNLYRQACTVVSFKSAKIFSAEYEIGKIAQSTPMIYKSVNKITYITCRNMSFLRWVGLDRFFPEKLIFVQAIGDFRAVISLLRRLSFKARVAQQIKAKHGK